MKSPTTIPARRANTTRADARDAVKIIADARRATGVRPPDDDEASPETLEASRINRSQSTGGAVDENTPEPRGACRIRVTNVGRGKVAVAHATGAPAAELGPESFVEVLLDVGGLLLVRHAAMP